MYHICSIFGGGFWQFGNLANQVNIAKLNVCHLSCKHGFLFIEYSKSPINSLANCIFRTNHQIFDLLIIPRIVDTRYHIQGYFCSTIFS